MKQKIWSARDAAALDAERVDSSSAGDDSAVFDALLQAATLAAGGEGSDTPCAVGVPPWWSRNA